MGKSTCGFVPAESNILLSIPNDRERRNSFTLTPNYESNTLLRLPRDRKSLNINPEQTVGKATLSDQSITVPEQAGNEPRGTIEVTIKHQGMENKIIGTPDGVIREILAYYSKLYPTLDLVSKIVLTSDSSEFLQACSGILAASQE